MNVPYVSSVLIKVILDSEIVNKVWSFENDMQNREKQQTVDSELLSLQKLTGVNCENTVRERM